MERITTPAGITVSYERSGSGPPLVLVHGSPTNHMTAVMVGEMEAAFITCSSVVESTARALDPFPEDMQYAVSRAILCKEIVTAKAVEVVEKAVEIAGGRAYFRKSPLERLARDVRAGRFHPPASPVSFQMAGERVREQAS